MLYACLIGRNEGRSKAGGVCVNGAGLVFGCFFFVKYV